MAKSFDQFRQSLDELTAFQDPPTVLVMRRKAIRLFPNNQRVATYRNDNLELEVAIPYDPSTFGHRKTSTIATATNEEVDALDEIRVLQGDRVQINSPGHRHHGKLGTAQDSNEHPTVKLDDGHYATEVSGLNFHHSKLARPGTVSEDTINKPAKIKTLAAIRKIHSIGPKKHAISKPMRAVLTGEEVMDEGTPKHTNWVVVPHNRKAFCTQFQKKEDAEYHAFKYGGKVHSQDQHGRIIKSAPYDETEQHRHGDRTDEEVVTETRGPDLPGRPVHEPGDRIVIHGNQKNPHPGRRNMLAKHGLLGAHAVIHSRASPDYGEDMYWVSHKGKEGLLHVSDFSKDTLHENAMSGLVAIRKTRTPATLKFRNGSGTMVHHEDAHRICALHAALNKANKRKIEALVNASPDGLKRVIEFANVHFKAKPMKPKPKSAK